MLSNVLLSHRAALAMTLSETGGLPAIPRLGSHSHLQWLGRMDKPGHAFNVVKGMVYGLQICNVESWKACHISFIIVYMSLYIYIHIYSQSNPNHQGSSLSNSPRFFPAFQPRSPTSALALKNRKSMRWGQLSDCHNCTRCGSACVLATMVPSSCVVRDLAFQSLKLSHAFQIPNFTAATMLHIWNILKLSTLSELSMLLTPMWQLAALCPPFGSQITPHLHLPCNSGQAQICSQEGTDQGCYPPHLQNGWKMMYMRHLHRGWTDLSHDGSDLMQFAGLPSGAIMIVRIRTAMSEMLQWIQTSIRVYHLPRYLGSSELLLLAFHDWNECFPSS